MASRREAKRQYASKPLCIWELYELGSAPVAQVSITRRYCMPGPWWGPFRGIRAPSSHLTSTRRGRRLLGRGRGQLAPLLEHTVNEAVAYRLVPVHETVAVRVLLDSLDALAGVLGQDLVEPDRK